MCTPLVSPLGAMASGKLKPSALLSPALAGAFKKRTA
jgi:hypothetical protein